LLIRKLMLIKYNDHQQRKLIIENNKKASVKKSVSFQPVKVNNEANTNKVTTIQPIKVNTIQPIKVTTIQPTKVNNGHPISNEIKEQPNIDSIDSLIKELLQDEINKPVVLNENDFESMPKVKSLNELDDRNNLYDHRDVTEYSRDYVNNGILDRLNIDMDIYKMKDIKNIKQNKKKELLPPYADQVDGMYASFNDSFTKTAPDFSNKRINNKNIKQNK